MSISTICRQVKNVAYNFSDAQVKVREATSNDPWGPSTALMYEIAYLTHNPMAFTEIMSIVWKRLNDSGKNWRHVYKSLVLLDFLINFGDEKEADRLATTKQGTVSSGQLTQSALDDLLSLGVGELVSGNSDQPSSSGAWNSMGMADPSGVPQSSTPASAHTNDGLFTSSNNDPCATSAAPQPAASNSDPFAAWETPVASAPAATLTSSISFDLLGGDLLSSTNSMTTSTTNSTNGTRKTPENFLGENKNLVNLDNLLGSNAPSTAGGNPFLTSSAPAANPFAAQQRKSPTLNEMRAALDESNEVDPSLDSTEEESISSAHRRAALKDLLDFGVMTPVSSNADSTASQSTEESSTSFENSPSMIRTAPLPAASSQNMVTPSTNEMYLESRRTKAVVTSTYKPRSDDELGLIKGEHVYIVKKSAHDFWKGQTTNGCCGWFPSNCVMEIVAQAQKPPPSEQKESAISKKGPTSEKMASLIADLQIGFRLPGTTPNIPAKTTPVTEEVAQEEEVTVGTIIEDPRRQGQRAEENGQDTMEHKPWFFGPISEGRAEELLHHGQKGEFLVRDSESNPGDLSISMRGNKRNKHFKVQNVDGQLKIHKLTFKDMDALINYYTTHQISSSKNQKLYLSGPLPK
ncbi:hypothetical protein CAEBREN_14617 [Caenorhabditis brenneri]|uniref:Uncharacterized protein n=1 Tax=Caenorhabditis brenneri TaxID=135651 RepID=G0NB84_CAEBE|nr:hypothetical protein CAEBREN_14617 [Caenorhabditis brenneri]